MAELGCVTLGLILSSATHARVSYLFRKDKHGRKSQGPYLKNRMGPNEAPLLVMDPLGAALVSLDMIFDVYNIWLISPPACLRLLRRQPGQG